MLYTLSQVVPFFVELDKASFDHADKHLNPWDKPVDRTAKVDKALRNISQRFYLPPAASEGRTNLYTAGGIAALRMIYNAADFGLNQIHAEEYARWMQTPKNGLIVIDEAINRVRNGDDFGFHVVVLEDDYQIACYADWHYQSSPMTGELARFTAPASGQIRALLALMDAES